MTFRGYKIPIAFSVLVWCLVWEVVGRLGLISLIPPFTEVLGAMPEVMGSASSPSPRPPRSRSRPTASAWRCP